MAPLRRALPRMSADDARATLARLHLAAAVADPLALAPPAWITDYHHALRSIASREDLQRSRVDGLHGINMVYFHRRVGGVLEAFDQLVARKPRPRPRRNAGMLGGP